MRLECGVFPAQHLGFLAGLPGPDAGVDLGLADPFAHRSAVPTPSRSVTRPIASHSEVESLRRSATICTARAFRSSGYRLDEFEPTGPSFPTEELTRHPGADHLGHHRGAGIGVVVVTTWDSPLSRICLLAILPCP